MAQRRRVQPVPEGQPDPEQVFDPESAARPALAVWLADRARCSVASAYSAGCG